jgi:hypothetical protein
VCPTRWTLDEGVHEKRDRNVQVSRLDCRALVRVQLCAISGPTLRNFETSSMSHTRSSARYYQIRFGQLYRQDGTGESNLTRHSLELYEASFAVAGSETVDCGICLVPLWHHPSRRDQFGIVKQVG